jgi:hypothetical protein
VIGGNDAKRLVPHKLNLTTDYADYADSGECNLRCSCTSLMQNNRFFLLISKPFKRNAPYYRYPTARNFAEE